MHVIIKYKYKKDRMKNSQEKVAKSILDAQGQLTMWFGVRSGRFRTHTSSYVCKHYLQV